MGDEMIDKDLCKIKVVGRMADKEKVYNFGEELKTDSFLKNLKKSGATFKSVAKIIKNENKASGYEYIDKCKEWGGDKGWVYVISANDRVVKIGQTDATLSSRFSSYQAGTHKNRDKGTCSVTNWNCSEFWRVCLSEGVNLEVFAYQVPTTETKIKVFGQYKIARNKHAYLYENALLNKYESLKGNKPILSNNNSQA